MSHVLVLYFCPSLFDSTWSRVWTRFILGKRQPQSSSFSVMILLDILPFPGFHFSLEFLLLLNLWWISTLFDRLADASTFSLHGICYVRPIFTGVHYYCISICDTIPLSLVLHFILTGMRYLFWTYLSFNSSSESNSPYQFSEQMYLLQVISLQRTSCSCFSFITLEIIVVAVKDDICIWCYVFVSC